MIINVVGIFEKPDAEAQAAAKSRRLNLLEVCLILHMTCLPVCMYLHKRIFQCKHLVHKGPQQFENIILLLMFVNFCM